MKQYIPYGDERAFRVPSADEKCRREIKQKRIAANQKTIKIKQNTEVQTIGQEFLRRDVDRRQSGQPHNIPSLFFVSFLDIQSSLGFAKVFCVFLCGDFVENLLWKCGNLF